MKDALSKVVWATIVMLPDVNNMIWVEAKRMAMNVEAIRVCAQSRISALVRMQYRKEEYSKQKAAAVVIEKHIRSFLARTFASGLLRNKREKEERKRRSKCAIVVQTIWRRFFWRNRFILYQERIERERIERISVARAKLQEFRQRERASIILRRVIRSDSIIAIATISINEICHTLVENSMFINVYTPTTKETFSFTLNESTIRECLEMTLSSWDEMLKESVLNKLLERLLLRVVRGRPIFIFCKRNIVEKGTLVDKRVVSAAGELFILSIFRSPHDFAFSAYQCSVCQHLRIILPMFKLHEWLSESKRKSQLCTMPIDQEKVDTSIKDQKTQKELIEWLVNRVILRMHPSGTMQLLFQFEVEEERISKHVTKVQAQWRRLLSLRIAKQRVKNKYEKIFVREISAYAYKNVRTDECQWMKPIILGDDDIGDPIDEWRIEETIDSSTGQKQMYYANYATGMLLYRSSIFKLSGIAVNDSSSLNVLLFGIFQQGKPLGYLNRTPLV